MQPSSSAVMPPVYSIVLSEEARKKKPSSYFLLPDDSITRTNGKNPHQWFSFVKGCYYPLALKNNSDHSTAHDLSAILTMTIEMKEGTTISVLDKTVLSTKPIKGIYWFGAIEPHVGGTYIITFDCEGRKDVSALTCTFTVPYSSEEKEMLELIKNAENEPQKKKMKVSNTPSKKGKADDTASPSQASLSSHFDVLAYPKNAFLTAKGRLQRMKKPYTIVGPVMQATLPASLVVAILDDRDSYKALVDSKCGVFSVQTLKQDPTVNDLFHRTQLRLHKVIVDVENLMDVLRSSFEYAFESSILYTYEKENFQGVLNELKKQEICYCDIFGGKYLLRFLISMLMYSSVMEGEEDDETGVKGSLQRRNAVHSKLSKTKFHPLERVIHEIIKELDEYSHYIF